jgi:hypothetical protein
MALGKTFYMLKNAEIQAGELYVQIGLSVSIAHPGLSELFNDLAQEEELHAKQIELLRNLFLQSEDVFLENPETEKMIAEFMRNLETVKDYFNLHLERNLVEKHRLFFMKAADPQIKNLLENLNLADAGHIRKLEAFQPG